MQVYMCTPIFPREERKGIEKLLKMGCIEKHHTLVISASEPSFEIN